MATEIKVPALGESVTEATVAKWLKKVGDSVKVDDPLVDEPVRRAARPTATQPRSAVPPPAMPPGESHVDPAWEPVLGRTLT